MRQTEGRVLIKTGIHNYHEVYNKNNNVFDPSFYQIGDDLGYPIILLRDTLLLNSVEINTLDICSAENCKKIIFLDMPRFSNQYLKHLVDLGIELYLVVLESKLHRKQNWNMVKHKFFKKIFTWDSSFVDNKKYIKLNYAFRIPSSFKVSLNNKNKNCCLISCNKSSSDHRELYSERVKAIRWFEKNRYDDFDLYGMGWDKFLFKGPLISKFNRFSWLRKSLAFLVRYPSYRGVVAEKRKVLSSYKFSICYENAENIPGYITEKIFDCFFAGTVPIYLGAPDIAEHIPAECFVDKRKYPTYEELYAYLSNMPDEEYLAYIKAIEDFINGDKVKPFSAEYFAETITKEVLAT